MFARCDSPVWRVDDFTECFEQDYLQTLLPLIICGVSFLYLILQIYRAWQQSKHYTAYHSLNSWRNAWSFRPAQHSLGTNPFDNDDSDTEDELERNADLALVPTRTNDSFVELDRPKGEVLLVVIEELAVLGELAIHVAALIEGKGTLVSRVSGVAVWAYVTILASARLLFSNTKRLSFPRLWFHTASIYCFLWLFEILLFRSAIIHPKSKLGRNLTIADFALTTLLAVIALTSRKGNRPVELEYEGHIQPSKEQTASVLSIATFGWVDAIVWQGYKKTFEMADVWNLAPKDKAAAILAQYRQFKKTQALSWHLLRYFRRELIIQAAWAACSGFFLFVPTILLKLILEYVENPASTPRNAAWFYVILLFLSGVTSALADGQALWIGRKICIRLRAIIIGEIYAKALKRRAASGGDKILGEKKPEWSESKKDRFKRVMSFRRKKARPEATKPSAAAANGSETQVSSGAIINLMAVDSFKVAEISAYLHFLWANTPVQVVVSVLLLYRILGLSSVAGIGMMIFLLPINMLISKRFAAIQKQILAATDARIHTTNEILTNIRIIKYFAWEQRFMAQVNEKRAVELANLRRRYQWWAAAATVWSGAPIIITFLSFFFYTIIEKKDLVPSVAFTALSLFQLLRIPLDQLADMVAHVQESKVSVDRIEEYLNEPETDKYKQLKSEEFDENDEPLIGFDHGTFSWGTGDSKDGELDDAFKMLDLDIRFPVGQLSVIVGSTGCGKTSLLMALLGEMTLVQGKVYLPGGRCREDLSADPDTGLTESVAYCAQQAWLMNGTIKENIVFNSPFDPKRYKDVIVACSLQRDLEILDAGDQTLVGEKGVTLSGGQKQRISLARALYSKARHVLLDDVLSAVDSHTAKWIFDQALLGPLMYNRTCILVTHNVQLCLPHSEFAVLLDNGRVAVQGTPNDLIDSGRLSEDLSKSRPVSRGPSRVASRVPSDVGGEEALGENGHANGGANGHANGTDKPKESQEETKAVGGVKIGIILMYLRSMGSSWYWVAAFIAFAAQQLSSVATNVWIRQWANAYDTKQVSIFGAQKHSSHVTHTNVVTGLGSCLTSGSCVWPLPWFSSSQASQNNFHDGLQVSMVSDSNSKVDAGYYLGIYAILGIIFMIITLSREAVLFWGSLGASRRIHQRLVNAVMHAKFRFFDSTPLGQLMNRFSKDIESIDQEIAPVAIGVVHCFASILTVVALISIIIPAFLIAGIFISLLFFFIGMFYINASRDLKRLESVQRSPLYQQFGETLSGMTTIRAYGDERRFIRENLTRVNTHNRPFIYLWAANRWLAFRVDVVGSMVSFFSGVFVILSIGRLDAGAAGLAMTYAVTFTDNVLWFVRLYAANEQNMNSVERIKEYLDVEQEAPPVIEDNRPPSNWPSRGSVEFIGYSTRYRADFDYVLKGITFKIAPGEKVGVVGRTGAGKSSLALALFRALEAEEGKILVDDVDIGMIGLQDLRENIVMVPQDPTLFSGTIRSNLDPFGLFTDEEIFTALRRVQLVGSAAPSAQTTRPPSPTGSSNGVVRSKKSNDKNAQLRSAVAAVKSAAGATANGSSEPSTPGTPSSEILENKNIFRNLNSPVSESGSNLSQGQRQLLCLARALLKAPKVLLMDEATASIDYATDAKIQETIREIRNTTITIAHRLQTICDYDKVLVLDRGEVIEFGDPWELMQRKKGVFRGMCETSGDLEVLEREARKASEARRLVDGRSEE
ncbi:ATP-dependent bile acid permease [Lasiodiplodia hormozganensis]|uniref:ATP-dependent bile acid permease n=1 Tax=Lasiodiplodia hormozganensis TaxID=869390 RepID=A0AA39XC34_9PEZI|nr:ATP-dependent bile acid permease [Lasiodiplodia hormozganensis]